MNEVFRLHCSDFLEECLQIKIRRVDSIFLAQPALPSISNCQEAFAENVCHRNVSDNNHSMYSKVKYSKIRYSKE